MVELGISIDCEYRFVVNFDFDIPDEIQTRLGKDRAEAEKVLRQELALVFYSRGWLGAGRAAEYGGVTRLEFEKWLVERNVTRPLDEADLAAEWTPV